MKLSVIVFGLVSKISLIIEKKWWRQSHGGFPWTNNFLLLSLIDASLPMQMALENGSVTTLTYEKGTFTIQGINDISYIEKGKRSLKSAVCLKRRLSVKMTDNLLLFIL